jgi:hypothetical protein
MLGCYGTVVGIVILACAVDAASAEEPSGSLPALVNEALFQEALGDNAARSDLLRQAAQASAEAAAIHWARGEVLMHDRWLSPEQVGQAAREDPLRIAYRARRAATGHDAEGQWKLAQWCKEQELPLQFQAHVAGVLQAAPEHAGARHAAGFVRVKGRWVHTEERKAEKAHAEGQRAALNQWRPTLERIGKHLSFGSQQQRQSAEKELAAIVDPQSVNVIELLYCSANPRLAAYGIEHISAVDDPCASVALARQAISSPWQATRDLATEKLRHRPIEEYAPLLLSALQSPIDARLQMESDSVGRVTARSQLSVETQYAHQVLLTQANYDIKWFGINRNGSFEMRYSPEPKVFTQVARQNLARLDFNDRITQTLAATTGAKMGDEPRAWWKWWMESNELHVPDKPIFYEYAYQTYAYSFFTVRMHSCFVKGTPVWTVEGMQSIEEIVPGDLVLAQDIDTGELAYKPVLQTTVRPPAAIVRIEAGDALTIDTTGGHRFWVSGDGWVKARDLTSGSPLHTATGVVIVSNVQERPLAPAYNLVVGDYHNYFVTDAKVLCQDNMMPRPTAVKVPGLSRQWQ